MSRLVTLAVALAAVALAACTTELPAVDPTAFACTDDRPADDGLLQCPASHWCDEGGCAPRLGCLEPDSAVPGCRENVRRCDLVTSAEISAAACVSGLHTETSTPVADLDGCPCPDGLHCVALAHVDTASSSRALPLYMFPTTLRPARLPAASLGAAGELAYGRMCVRACSSELDCPAGSTCRPTAVLEPSTLAGSDQGRHTIGACYPNVLATTSTPTDQPDPSICRARVDCSAPGRLDSSCVVRIDPVDDHPTRPIGDAWSERVAIIPHCVEAGGGSTPDGIGCTEDSGCRSGICFERRCARLCDPALPESCALLQTCNEVQIERPLSGGRVLYDRINLCQG